MPAAPDTLWLLYSNTKVLVAAALWKLVEDGALRFDAKIADHIPDFARHGKGAVTLAHLLTHQAGFPNAAVSAAAWEDHALLRREICDFKLEWPPGARVHYHAGSAHWVAAALIEAVTGVDYRDVVRRRIIEPLGLAQEIYLGLPESEDGRAADMHDSKHKARGHLRFEIENSALYRRAGLPGAGGFATARGMAAFYQALLRQTEPPFFPQLLMDHVTRNFTGERIDEQFGIPMRRGLGVQTRGQGPSRGLGSLASPSAFGHGGAGSSFCWGDPETGVSFAYLTNGRVQEPWHSQRLEIVSNAVHEAIEIPQQVAGNR
jgi:CubicO group peptidase (beta-lactamase class C family)